MKYTVELTEAELNAAIWALSNFSGGDYLDTNADKRLYAKICRAHNILQNAQPKRNSTQEKYIKQLKKESEETHTVNKRLHDKYEPLWEKENKRIENMFPSSYRRG